MTAPYGFELIRSRSTIDQQIAAHQATHPYLCGTKPLVSSISDATTTASTDSFIGATLNELAVFVTTKFSPVQEIMSSTYFVVIDAESLQDYSVILVKIQHDNLPESSVYANECDSEGEAEAEDLDEDTRQSVAAHLRREIDYPALR